MAFSSLAWYPHRASSSFTAFRVTRAAMIGTIIAMPLTVFDIKGIPGSRRERIEAAVVAGGRHASGPHEAWIATDPFKRGFRILTTCPQGFERTVLFDL